MADNSTIGEKKDIAYYMMNMPEWFLNLPDEEKIDLAKKFSDKSNTTNFLNEEEVVELLMGRS